MEVDDFEEMIPDLDGIKCYVTWVNRDHEEPIVVYNDSFEPGYATCHSLDSTTFECTSPRCLFAAHGVIAIRPIPSEELEAAEALQ